MRLMFVAGGTGGHINPAIAVAKEMKRLYPDCEILFVGTENRMETRIVPKAGFNIATVEMNGFSRKISLKGIAENIKTVRLTLRASGAAKRIIRDFLPDAVIGFGGYVTGPVLREAVRLGVKTAIHEQNAFPGVANKALAKSVDRVMLTVPDAEKYMRCKNPPVVTGLPVRREIVAADRDFARAELGVVADKTLVLSMGGSLGADAINNAVVEMLAELGGNGGYHFIHATGSYGKWVADALAEKGIAYGAGTNIEIREYIDNMEVCLPACDIVISRAGASSISEIQSLSKPSVLIPSPNVAENHQFHNAMALARHGGAVLLEEKELSGKRLADIIRSLRENHGRLAEISENAGRGARINALSDICDIIKALAASA